jgi:hypothetical protein
VEEEMQFSQLKEKHREIRDGIPQSLSLRIHRALSWLHCSEQNEDDDSKFIFLWIAFNAAYAHEIPKHWEVNEKKVLTNFIRILINSDKDGMLSNLVWKEFPSSIRLLIDNKFVYQKFWDYQNDEITEEEWIHSFQKSKRSAKQALGKSNTGKVLGVVFERLYSLRNQIIHGGSTWNSSVNRDQIRDGVKIMSQIVPVIISIMLNNEPRLLGNPRYPVVS